ncbi:hypothetical protein [Williamsia sp. M5A3_1d]
MNGIRHERIIDEKRRLRVVRCWYALHLVVIVAVILGLLIRNGPPASWGFAVGLGLWLGTFATSSVLLLTVGLLGVYEKTSTVVTVKGLAASIAVATGFLLYGLGIMSTPILAVIGIVLRLVVLTIQRALGVRRIVTEPVTRPAA